LSQTPNPQISQTITYHVDGYSKARLMKLGKNAKKVKAERPQEEPPEME